MFMLVQYFDLIGYLNGLDDVWIVK